MKEETMLLYDDALTNASTQAQIVLDEIRRWMRDETRSNLSLQRVSEAILVLEEIYQLWYPFVPEEMRERLHGLKTLSTEFMTQALKGGSDEHLSLLIAQISLEQEGLKQLIETAAVSHEAPAEHGNPGDAGKSLNGNGWWRSTAVKLVGVLGTLLIAWLSYQAAWTLQVRESQIKEVQRLDLVEKILEDFRRELREERLRRQEIDDQRFIEVKTSIDQLRTLMQQKGVFRPREN